MLSETRQAWGPGHALVQVEDGPLEPEAKRLRKSNSCPLLDFSHLDLGDVKWFLLQQAGSPPEANAVLKCGDVLGFAIDKMNVDVLHEIIKVLGDRDLFLQRLREKEQEGICRPRFDAPLTGGKKKQKKDGVDQKDKKAMEFARWIFGTSDTSLPEEMLDSWLAVFSHLRGRLRAHLSHSPPHPECVDAEDRLWLVGKLAGLTAFQAYNQPPVSNPKKLLDILQAHPPAEITKFLMSWMCKEDDQFRNLRTTVSECAAYLPPELLKQLKAELPKEKTDGAQTKLPDPPADQELLTKIGFKFLNWIRHLIRTVKPERERFLRSAFCTTLHLWKVPVEEGSPLIGRSIGELNLRNLHKVHLHCLEEVEPYGQFKHKIIRKFVTMFNAEKVITKGWIYIMCTLCRHGPPRDQRIAECRCQKWASSVGIDFDSAEAVESAIVEFIVPKHLHDYKLGDSASNPKNKQGILNLRKFTEGIGGSEGVNATTHVTMAECDDREVASLRGSAASISSVASFTDAASTSSGLDFKSCATDPTEC